MAVPKKRTGKSAQAKRRANWKATKPETTICSNCGQPVLAHTVCTACGFYKGKPVSLKDKDKKVEVKEEVKEVVAEQPAEEVKEEAVKKTTRKKAAKAEEGEAKPKKTTAKKTSTKKTTTKKTAEEAETSEE